jgi:hypothetical protein
MAKSKQRKSGKKAGKQGPAKARMLKGLDEAAAAWARLLDDPCAALLAPPCYPTGSGGGTLVRVEADYVYGGGANTAAAVLFTPALMGTNPGSVQDVSMSGFVAVTDATSTAWNSTDLFAFQPGSSTGAQWSGVRPVAACVQMYWPGSELNRQGIVSLGNVSAGLLESTPTTVSFLRTLSQNVQRTPEGMVEIKWRPGEADNQFLNPNAPPATNATLAGHNSILVTWAGIPVSTGMRFRAVVVYEVQFNTGTGFVVQPQVRSGSRYSVNDILGYLDSTGNWALKTLGQGVGAYNTGARLYKATSNILSAGARVLPALAW